MKTKVAHTGRAHATRSASGAERWIDCPASIVRASAFESKSSVFAKEGTAAHECCEFFALNRKERPRAYIGGVVILGDTKPVRKKLAGQPSPDNDNTWRITQEMVVAVEMYLAVIDRLRTPDSTVLIESKVEMGSVHPDAWGTADCIIYDSVTKTITIIDFKYGSGIAVDADWNPQLLLYAIGAARQFRYQVEHINIVVVQPRAWHPLGPIREFDCDIIDLLIYEEWLRQKAARTDCDDAEAQVGPGCRFCSAAPVCPTLHDHVFATLGLKPGRVRRDRDMPALKNLTASEMGRIFREVKIIEAWINRFLEYAHDQALAGNMPTGCVAVESRSIRKWKDAEAVLAELEALGFEPEEIMSEPNLLSPAQIEGLIGKKLFAQTFGDAVDKPKGKPVLALEGDHRPPIKLDKTDAFGSVEDEED